MIKEIVYSSMIDYPDKICSVIFLGGCNFNCSYCHNKNLIELSDIPIEKILYKLLSRKAFVDHIVISGGEPTIHDSKLTELVNILKRNGFKIGLHTNGSNLNWLQQNIKKLDFIGLDIKTSLDRYSFFNTNLSEKYWIKLLKYLKKYQKKKKIEIRTTVDSDYHTGINLEVLAINLKRIRFNKKYVKWILRKSSRTNKASFYATSNYLDTWIGDYKKYLNIEYQNFNNFH